MGELHGCLGLKAASRILRRFDHAYVKAPFTLGFGLRHPKTYLDWLISATGSKARFRLIYLGL